MGFVFYGIYFEQLRFLVSVICVLQTHRNEKLKKKTIEKRGGELTKSGEYQCSTFAPVFRKFKLCSDKSEQSRFMQNIKVCHMAEERVRKTAKV